MLIGFSFRSVWLVVLKCFWLGHKFGNFGKESAGGAAVDDSVIKAECEAGFGLGNEASGFIVPDGLFAAGAHAENEGLFGQRNGRGPSEAEGSEVGDGGDGTPDRLGWKASFSGLVDEFLVARRHFGERLLVGLAQDGNEDAVFGFNGKADVDV